MTSVADAVCVVRWSAAVCDRAGERPTLFGHCADEAAIPPAYRRRMGMMERIVARCALGLLTDAERTEIVLCSRFGNLGTLIALLQALSNGEPVSPMAFSGSVHNVLAGVLGQIRGDRSAHTAVACGRDTLTAGIVEAWCKLAVDPLHPLILVFGDEPLPAAYHRFADADDEGGTTVLAMLLRSGMSPGISEQPTHILEPVGQHQAAAPGDGSHRLARRVILHLQTGTPLTFRGPHGPGWRIGPPR